MLTLNSTLSKRHIAISILIIMTITNFIIRVQTALIRLDIELFSTYSEIKLSKKVFSFFPDFEIICKYNETFNPPKTKMLLLYENDTTLNTFANNGFLPQTPEYNDIQHFHSTVIHGRNMFVSGDNAICTLKYYYDIGDRNNLTVSPFFNGTIVGEYESVVAIGHLYTAIYGHFINEIMAPSQLIPAEIRKKSYIVVQGNRSMCEELVRVLDFEDRIIYLTCDQFVFCRDLYTVCDPRTHGGYYGPCLGNLSIVVRKYFNLTKIQPLYVGLHKRRGPTRVIANLNEIINFSKNLNESIQFMYVPDITNTTLEIAKIHASLRVLVGSTGSNLIRSIYMHPFTCVVQICPPSFNFAVTVQEIVCNLYSIVVTEPKFSFREKSPQYINITKTYKAINIALYVTEHHEWPNISEFHLLK